MKKKFFIFLAFAAFILALFLVGVRGYVRWEGRHYFGRIVKMTEEGFTISEAGIKERIVDVEGSTIVKKGTRTQLDGLRAGDQVIVIGDTDYEGHIKARLIRVVDEKRAGSLD